MNTSKRRRVAIAIVATTCVLLGLTVISPNRPGISKANLNRVKTGMTRTEVEELFGEGGSEFIFATNGGQYTVVEDSRQMFVWYAADWSGATVWFEGDRVVEMEWHDSNETIFEKIRRWLHL